MSSFTHRRCKAVFRTSRIARRILGDGRYEHRTIDMHIARVRVCEREKERRKKERKKEERKKGERAEKIQT